MGCRISGRTFTATGTPCGDCWAWSESLDAAVDCVSAMASLRMPSSLRMADRPRLLTGLRPWAVNWSARDWRGGSDPVFVDAPEATGS